METKNQRQSGKMFNYLYGKITVHSQTFRSFDMTPLFIGIIFGTTFEHLYETEILYRSNKVIVVHINTMKRVNELFSALRSDSLNRNCYFSAASNSSLIKLEDEETIVGYLL